MGLLRSEEMSHGTLVLPNDRAREFIDLLGRKMNAGSTNRPYKKQISRIEELERILRVLYEQIDKLDASVESGFVDAFLESDNEYSLDNVEQALQQLYVQFVRFDANNTNLKKERDFTVFEKYVLLAAAATYHASGSSHVDMNEGLIPGSRPALSDDYAGLVTGRGAASSMGLQFSTIAGVIPKADQDRFGRILFRATRGNCFTFCHPVEDEAFDSSNGAKRAHEKMTVFVVYFQGGANSAMKEKIEKIAKTFGAKTYAWPQTLAETQERLRQVEITLQEKQAALDGYERYFISQIAILLEARPGHNSLIEDWRLFCVKEKALYATINLFEGEDLALRARCWFPKAEEHLILQLLASHGSTVESPALLFVDHEAGKPKPTRGHGADGAMVPPTYFKSNSLMLPFQLLVDTYGVPRYMEANPALTATVMFPFLFGVMYGDIGHGIILLAFSIYLCVNAKKFEASKDHPLKGFVNVRFMFLLMSIFSVYAGFMYNDFMAVGHDFFGKTKYIKNPASQTEWIRPEGAGTYGFGLDPVWKGASNELTFVNSMKMKFAIVVGVFHMCLGICMKGSNALFFGAMEDFWFEFLPQIVFMIAMFGYLALLIIIKWCQDVNAAKPQLITTLIDMFLSVGSEIGPKDEIISGQASVQVVLVLIIVLCIPVMLCIKPFYLKNLHKKKLAAKLHSASGASSSHRRLEDRRPPQVGGRELSALEEADQLLHDPHHADHEDHFEFGEVFVHQMIETIEFAMGSVSNTASYLRLWALSLAHAQLSLVFYERLMQPALKYDGGLFIHAIMTFVLFAAFMVVTTGVILLMDVLECFLHALRLQWVEFQNKFYKADGYKFAPYSHKTVLTAEE